MPVPTQAQRDRLALAGGANFTAIPDADAPLSWPTSGVVVISDGNMGLVMSGGTDNDSALIPVVAGAFYPFQAVALSPSNTAGLLGIDGIASDDGLSISGTPLLLADQNSPYAGFALTLSGGLPPCYAYLGSGALPAGMTVEPTTGVPMGSPSATGSFAGIVIRVRDHAGFVASLAPFTLVVNSPLTISGTPVLTGTNGTPYAGFTVSSTGGSGTNVFSVISGALPDGLTIDGSTGDVAGTPTVTAAFPGIVLGVTDAAGVTKTLAPFTITISA